jgi:4-diphosphocytidyl-2C-methyl-D-erythritol kinase
MNSEMNYVMIVAPKNSIIESIIENLKNSGAKIAKMSGSGATCFGIFENEKKLELTRIDELNEKLFSIILDDDKFL